MYSHHLDQIFHRFVFTWCTQVCSKFPMKTKRAFNLHCTEMVWQMVLTIVWLVGTPTILGLRLRSSCLWYIVSARKGQGDNVGPPVLRMHGDVEGHWHTAVIMLPILVRLLLFPHQIIAFFHPSKSKRWLHRLSVKNLQCYNVKVVMSLELRNVVGPRVDTCTGSHGR